MLKLERVQICGLEPAMRGARNPMNSWAKSDSCECVDSCDDCANFGICNANNEPYFKRFWEHGSGSVDYAIGPNDHDLAMRLRNAGTDHRKYMRMIVVYVDITAPLLWWKEFDTYKIGTVANSCSTMHKIHAKEFVLDDFTHENLRPRVLNLLVETIGELNFWRDIYINGGTDKYFDNLAGEWRGKTYEPKDKEAWRQMIDILPTSYNQMRTIMFSYEALANMYKSRRNHKLKEWHILCDFIERLPYSEFITGKVREE